MDEMLEGLKAKEAKKRKSNYPEAIRIISMTDDDECNPRWMLQVIAEHHPGIIVAAYKKIYE